MRESNFWPLSEFFSREKDALTGTFCNIFKHTYNFSRVLCQHILGSHYLFQGLERFFIVLSVKFFENSLYTEIFTFIFYEQFLRFFHGQSFIFTGTLLVFFAGRKIFLTEKMILHLDECC